MPACAKGERHVAKGYKVCCDVRGKPGIYSRDIIGSYIYIYFKTTRAGWQLTRVVMVAEDALNKALPHTIKILDLGNRYNVHLYEDKLKTCSEEVETWCWHVHETAKSRKKFFIHDEC